MSEYGRIISVSDGTPVEKVARQMQDVFEEFYADDIPPNHVTMEVERDAVERKWLFMLVGTKADSIEWEQVEVA